MLNVATVSVTEKECSSLPQVPTVTASPKKNSEKTVLPGPRATLVICPLSVLSNWQVSFHHEDIIQKQGVEFMFKWQGQHRKIPRESNIK